MKQVLRQLVGIHQASSLLLRTTRNFGRPFVVGNPETICNTRKFSSTQRDAKEPDSVVVKKEGHHLEQMPEKLTPEIEARMEYYRQKRQERKEILSMEEEELSPYLIGVKKSSYLEMREGKHAKAEISKLLEKDDDEKYNLTDQLAFIQQDLDFRLPAIKRWFAKIDEEWEIKLQKYNAQRNSVLGDDLAAAHFVVYRKGRVKFLGQDKWVDQYRTDADKDENELDLPDMQFDLCTLPTTYDPNYLVEAIDASNIPLRFEGLDNLANLPYCKFLKLENCTHLEAWCMDKLAYMFADRLEFLDISGCTGLTEGALCSLSRFRKLKTLVMRNLPQVKNMAVICAILEDSNPNLKIFGVNYEQRLNEIKTENEQLDKKEKEIEDNTITVETVHGPDLVLDSK